MTRGNRSRRPCLAVPGSSPRVLEKAQGLNADHGLDGEMTDEATRKLALGRRGARPRRRPDQDVELPSPS